MPITATKMAANEASLVVTGGTLGDDVINLVYFPNKVNTKIMNQIDLGLEERNQTLSEIIKSWDVLEEDGSMFPLDADRLGELSVAVMLQIARAILTDIRPN